MMAIFVWRNSDNLLQRSGWDFIRTKRFARFAALVLVTSVSASLYAVVLARWIHNHNHWKGDHERWLQDIHWVDSVRASVIWEGKQDEMANVMHTDSTGPSAITPLLFFIIFAAQDEIYELWLEQLSRFIHIPSREANGHREGGMLPMSPPGT